MAISTQPQRRLGDEIRRLRRSAGLTLKQVGAHIGVSEPQVGRIETAKRSCSREDLLGMLALFGVEEGTKAAVCLLWDQVHVAGDDQWWTPYSGVISSSYAEHLALEAAASRITEFQPMIPPGLLQTESYAYGLTQATGGGDDDRVEALVEVRMERQRRLFADDALEFRALMTEAMLQVQVGGPHVMAEQFDHMCRMAERPNVELLIVPFATGVYGAVASGFTLFEFPEQNDPSVVLQYVATSEAVTSESERDIRQVRRLARRIERAALTADESVRMLMKYRREMRSRS